MQLDVVHEVSPKSTSCQLDEGTHENCDQQVGKVDQKYGKFTLCRCESPLSNYYHRWVDIFVRTLKSTTIIHKKKTYSHCT